MGEYGQVEGHLSIDFFFCIIDWNEYLNFISIIVKSEEFSHV